MRGGIKNDMSDLAGDAAKDKARGDSGAGRKDGRAGGQKGQEGEEA